MRVVEDRPQVRQPVLDRRAGERDARVGLDRLDLPRLLRPGILDGLRLVDDRQTPRQGRKPGHPRQRAVTGDHQVERAEAIIVQRAQFGGRHRRRVRDQHPQPRREALGFRRPVRQKRRRGDQQRGAMRSLSPLVLQHQQQREHLDRLAQPHVVGEAGAHAQPDEKVEPTHAGLLVRTQLGLEIAARVDVGEAFGRPQSAQHVGEPRAGGHLRPIGGVGRRLVGRRAGQQPHRLCERHAVGLGRPLDG